MAAPTRRDALFGAACLCCAGIRPARAGAAAELIEVAPGLFFRRGADLDAAAGNDDAIANIGFAIGGASVCVIDPGGALADGEALRAALRRVTDRPISHVVMTHVHPDHVFGAGAFTRDRPVFVGHAGLPALLSQRGGFYRDRLNEVLGAGAAGPVVLPSMLVSDRGRIDLGGRVLRLTAHRPAHTGADLSVLDEATSTLITGDLVFVRRAPSLDGDLKGWLAVLADLRGAPARRAVPGHGPVSCDWPAAAADIERYLTTLLTETRAAIAAGTPMQAAAQSVARGERGRWLLFDDYNPRNVLEAYQALQWE